ncbi:HAD family hydrolase [Gracilibacillus oryzae]|uniref:HAD family hydrolase n=1 Tax=Gracilibacillus oryzae TaxID=1672701 RepID=A0A7C8GRS8_9BACI|nr:HAD family hydrolase [Gracilibacillus oryzae]KAB8129010.1 HAD family hydrolase [Gracilibacillus oryzae]
MIFDLDDTLLDRDKAVENLFFLIIEKCYEEVYDSEKEAMMRAFKKYDRRSYGYGDKTEVLESFFDEFPAKFRLPREEIQDFWNNHFPYCFPVNQHTINLVNKIKEEVKVAIVTNGLTQRQKAKIRKTKLNDCFDIIITSEEAGFWKPDKRIFEIALSKLNVQPEEALYIGDDIEKDIAGCQNANIKGIWFNPHMSRNDTEISPYAEIDSLDRLLGYFV